MFFVVVFSRSAGLRSIDSFEHFTPATAAVQRHILDNIADTRDVEVNLFEAKDEQTFRVTHRRYFETDIEAIAAVAAPLPKSSAR